MEKSKLNIIDLLSSKLFLTIVFIIQIVAVVVLVYLINPKKYYQTLQNRSVVNQVEQLVSVNKNEEPSILKIKSADGLRKENAINAEVYKNAKDKDYVLVYSNKMVVYRANGKRVIYEGDTPKSIIEKGSKALVENLVNEAKKAGLVSEDEAANPQVTVVTDPALVRKQNPDFYAKVAKNDVICLFPSTNVLVLYRPSEDKIINSGTMKTTVN